jgi:hypothetical protein
MHCRSSCVRVGLSRSGFQKFRCRGCKRYQQHIYRKRAYAEIGYETIEFIANVTKEGEKLILKNLHIQGSEAGEIGVKNLYEVARQIGRQEGVEKVIVEGGKRTTGKYKGTTPTPIEITVK